MIPSARLEAVVDLLGEANAFPKKPLDTVAATYFKKRRYIGSKDRQSIAETFYGVVRFWARIAFEVDRRGDSWGFSFFSGPSFSPEKARFCARLALLSYLLWHQQMSFQDLEGLFSGQTYAPALLTPFEKAWLQKAPLQDPPIWVKAGLPPAWWDLFHAQFKEETLSLSEALCQEGPVDIRVNTLKTTRKTLQNLLITEGVMTQETDFSPWGLRLEGRKPLSSLESFQKGLFEIQDEGSQLMTLLSGAQPGERILDLCAGAGGKTLALAAMMENKGHLLATDIAPWRLERARLRARRAGVFNVEFHPLDASWLRRKKKSFDRVLLDVPCSGTGAWRRTPEKKWRLSIEDLPSLRDEQAQIFNLGAELVKPGGVLLYGTCSLLEEENHQQVTTFLSMHPDFEVDSVKHILEPTIASNSPSERPFLEAKIPAEKLLVKKTHQPHLMNLQGGEFLELRPHQTNTDGFFLARLKRKQNS